MDTPSSDWSRGSRQPAEKLGCLASASVAIDTYLKTDPRARAVLPYAAQEHKAVASVKLVFENGVHYRKVS